jgi:endonuclease/exonuclease/phosphatase family metal-dependent hydrolase
VARLTLATFLIAGVIGCAGPAPERTEPTPTHSFDFVVNASGPPAVRPATAGVRVGTYNVRWLRDAEGLRADFAALHAVDVWCLQEVRLPDAEDLDQTAAETFADVLPAGRWYCAAAAVNRMSELRSRDWEVQVIASRLPLDGPAVWVLDEGSAIRKRRVALTATINVDGKAVRVVNTDHAPSLRGRPGENDRQVDALLRRLGAEPIPRVVVVGDFNCSGSFFPPSGNGAHARAIDARFTSAGFEPVGPKGATFRWGVFALRLDRIYARHLGDPRGYRLSASTGSDHHPVWCEILFEPR